MASNEFKAEYRELHKGEYNIYLPDNKNPNNPLLIYLHGYFGEYILLNLWKKNCQKI